MQGVTPSQRPQAAPPFGRLLLTVTLALSLFVVALGRYSLEVNREYATANARIQSQNLAQSIRQSISATIRRIDHTLITVTQEVEINLAAGTMNRARMDQILASEERLLPEAVAIRVADAEGRVILNNATGDPAASFADRPYFPYLRDHPEAGLFVTEPILGLFTKRWVITGARRYNLPDGRFGGVVVVPVFVETFQKALAGFEVGAGGMLVLRDNHGGLVARHPIVVKGQTLAFGDKTYSAELQRIMDSGAAQQTYFALTPFDQTQRILTFQRIPGAPLFVVASLAEDDYLAQWRRHRVVTYALIAAFLIVVWILAALLWVSWQKRERDAAALRASAAGLHTILQTAMDGFWMTDLQGRLLEVNEAYCRMTGYDTAELLSRQISDLEAVEVATETAAHIQKVMAGGSDRFETRHRRKDGHLIDVEISVQYQPASGGRLVAFLRDITASKQGAETLRRSVQLLAETGKVGKVGGWEIDVATGRQTWTAEVLDIHEVDAAFEPTLENGIQFYTPASRPLIKNAMQGAIARGEPFDVELEIITGKGHLRSVHAIGKPDLVHRRVYGFFQDITKSKQAETEKARLEAQLIQAQKMESVGRLAGGVAHDFNNMLLGILGNVDLALDEVPAGAPVRENLDEIRDCAQRSADLTRQLLAFARKQTIAPKVLDLNETVEGMLKMLERLIGEDIDLTWRPKTNLWPVMMDPSQVDQILANLCANARDAIAGVGHVTIEMENCSLDEAYCANHAELVPGDYVRLTVSDSGCGMDKPTLSQIFEPFFTTKDIGKGTGLGLATIYGIVKQNNGLISVTSEPGQGTSFGIYLPRLVEEETAASAADAAEAPVPRGHETILLVEDEAIILNLTQRTLERLGYTVLPARTPREALRLAAQRPQAIQVLVTDVVMPEMNGRELATQLRTLQPSIKCLFMSGYTADVIAHHGVLEPGVLFMPKPFTVRELAAKVRAALKPNAESAALG